MRMIRPLRSVVRRSAAPTPWAGAFVAVFALAGHTLQSQTPADGVYTAGQAARGQQVYRAQCAVCHGDALEGGIGPPLAGDGFLSIWGARPVLDLVDKIHNTMPLEAPAPLSRQESLELAAYVLQAGGFPTGEAELTDGVLAGGVVLPAAPTAAGPAAGGDLARAPAANLAQLMRAVTFPNSNIIFNVQLKDPGAQPPPAPGTKPFDYVEWGSTVYPGWQAIDLAALALVESTPLFLSPGRRCENGRPAPTDRADWKQYTEALVEAGRAAYRASQSRRVEAVVDVADQLNDACNNCHTVYRDAGDEGSGQGADRCPEIP